MAAVAMAQNMGYKFIQNTVPESETHHAVKSVADKNSIMSVIDGKSHGKHISLIVENAQTSLESELGMNKTKPGHFFSYNSENLNSLFSHFETMKQFNIPIINTIIERMANNQPMTQIDFYDYFNKYLRDEFEYDSEYDNYWQSTFGKYESIAKLDANLDKVIKKYSANMANEFNLWNLSLKSKPGYDVFIQKLLRLSAVNNIQLHHQNFER
jgi:hypothetical protein